MGRARRDAIGLESPSSWARSLTLLPRPSTLPDPRASFGAPLPKLPPPVFGRASFGAPLQKLPPPPVGQETRGGRTNSSSLSVPPRNSRKERPRGCSCLSLTLSFSPTPRIAVSVDVRRVIRVREIMHARACHSRVHVDTQVYVHTYM